MKKPASDILRAPRITEKGAVMAASNAYVFNVSPTATKREIADAVRDVYKVTPRKVTLLSTPRKKVFTRGTNRHGQTAAGKKAYVYLKQGDSIELM